jgi:subtilisin-like proprotein convertase family protein/tetratricopeptide (TPR) repeat protein
MLRVPRHLTRAKQPNTRTVSLIIATIGLLLLATSAYYLNEFRQQRREAQRNAVLLAAWQEELVTSAPAVQERDRLQQQILAAQEQFALASGLLPGTDIQVALVQRVLEAAEASGVEVTTLREEGAPLQDGSLVAWTYEIAATGALDRVTEFASRLEQEAFPAAFLSNPILNRTHDGTYLLAGTLTVYGSTLSTGVLVATQPVTPDQLGALLRRQAGEALARGDYERALSLLIRLTAVEPDALDTDQLLYEAYVAYADALMRGGRPDLARQQAESALAINPNGQEALALVVTVAQGAPPAPDEIAVLPTEEMEDVPALATAIAAPMTPATVEAQTPGQTLPLPPTIAVVAPTPMLPPTVPPIAQVQPRPTFAAPTGPLPLPPTVAPPAQRTAAPTFNTPAPMFTPPAAGALSPTPGASPTPGVATTPAGTPVATGEQFIAHSPVFLPNCGLTQIRGTVWDGAPNRPLNGVTVRVWWDGAAPTQVLSLPTGQDPTKGPGEWDVVLDNRPKEGLWYVAVVDRQTGRNLSAVQTVRTDTGPCLPNESGRQVVIQNFVRQTTAPVATATLAPGVGTPTPTRTPTPTGTLTVTPTTTGTATLTPTVTSTPTATATPTVTATPTHTPEPTISPTPTPEPRDYPRDEVPDLELPDGPAGRATSALLVLDDVVIRQAAVFLNIEHTDVSDLEVNLYHQDGTRVRLRNAGEEPGATSIRRWFVIEGASLNALAGKSALGTWTLEIIDTVEGRTGRLLSWTLRIYP